MTDETRARHPAWTPDSTSQILTQDPANGGELVVTRLEGLESGVVIEGVFRLGWLSRLTTDQVEFVGLLAFYRGNVQKVAAHLGLSYNTGRSRLDDIAAAIAGPPPKPKRSQPLDVLDRFQSGAIDYVEMMRLLKDA